MANYADASDIIGDVLFRGGEPQDGSSDYATFVVDALNRAYQGIWQGGAELDPDISEKWWWLSTYNVLTMEPALTTGSITITNNSQNFSLTGAPTRSLQGFWFKSNNHADVFRISSHTVNEATGQIESVYTGTSDTSAAFKIFKTDYSLATDVLYLASPMRAYQDSRSKIHGISDEELLARWPRNTIGRGVPRNFSQIGERAVRFSHYGGATSGDLIKIEYPYIKQPADLADSATSVPLVPRQYRKILADWTLSFLQDAKSDNKAGSTFIIAQSGLRSMARDNQRRKQYMGDDFARIIPRLNHRSRFSEILRSESGHLIGW